MKIHCMLETPQS